MTMESSLLPENPKRIDSCSSHTFNSVIDYYHLAQLFPESIVAFAVNDNMCYAIYVIVICTLNFAIWFYFNLILV